MSMQLPTHPRLRSRKHLIATEFIFSDPIPATCIQVTGSWDDWRIHSMNLQEPFVWHLILNLPRGTYRFRFLLDGKPTLSTRHPLSDSIAHIRTVHGPKHRRTRKVPKKAYDGVLWALRRMGVVDGDWEEVAEDAGLVAEPRVQGWRVWIWVVAALGGYLAILAGWYGIKWGLGKL